MIYKILILICVIAAGASGAVVGYIINAVCEWNTAKASSRSEVRSSEWLCLPVRITGSVARRLAESRGMPSKEPVFEITVEGDGIYMGYDAGLDYQKDGSTYETEWKLWPVESRHNEKLTCSEPAGRATDNTAKKQED